MKNNIYMKELKFYEGNIAPEDGTIFVFGSNPVATILWKYLSAFPIEFSP